MANIPQKGPAVRASKPGATSGGAGVACVSRIPTSLHQVLPVGRLVSSPTPNSPAGKPLQPKGQPLSDEQRLHHQPGALSNGKSPACVSPVPGRLPDKHPVERLENAALHASPIAKSTREGQRLSKKRLREFWKHVLEGIEALPTTPQSPSRQQGTPNTGAHNGEESGDAALHGTCGCGPSMARGDSPQPPQLPDDVQVSPVGPERAVPSPDPGPLPVLHSRCAPWEQADHGSAGQGKDSASQEPSLHGPRSASSGSAVAVPLPDSPPHYTEAGPSTSGSPDFVRPPMVTRRRRPGGRPTFATPPDHSMLRFTELLASSPADMLPHGAFHGQEEEVRVPWPPPGTCPRSLRSIVLP
ncbi:uncharacterized protein LOC144173093 [Haemaphysalis longicornis]